MDYGRIYQTRFAVLRKAFARFRENEEYQQFVEENCCWLEDYSLYIAVKHHQQEKSWLEWPQELKNREPQALAESREK